MSLYTDEMMNQDLLKIQQKVCCQVTEMNVLSVVEMMAETLSKLCGNIERHPEEEKYRKIKKNNNTINTTILNVKGGEQMLLVLGWEECGTDDFKFPITSLENMKHGMTTLFNNIKICNLSDVLSCSKTRSSTLLRETAFNIEAATELYYRGTTISLNDPTSLVNSLSNITGCNKDTSRALLEQCDWNLQSATLRYYDDGGVKKPEPPQSNHMTHRPHPSCVSGSRSSTENEQGSESSIENQLSQRNAFLASKAHQSLQPETINSDHLTKIISETENNNNILRQVNKNLATAAGENQNLKQKEKSVSHLEQQLVAGKELLNQLRDQKNEINNVSDALERDHFIDKSGNKEQNIHNISNQVAESSKSLMHLLEAQTKALSSAESVFNTQKSNSIMGSDVAECSSSLNQESQPCESINQIPITVVKSSNVNKQTAVAASIGTADKTARRFNVEDECSRLVSKISEKQSKRNEKNSNKLETTSNSIILNKKSESSIHNSNIRRNSSLGMISLLEERASNESKISVALNTAMISLFEGRTATDALSQLESIFERHDVDLDANSLVYVLRDIAIRCSHCVAGSQCTGLNEELPRNCPKIIKFLFSFSKAASQLSTNPLQSLGSFATCLRIAKELSWESGIHRALTGIERANQIIGNASGVNNAVEQLKKISPPVTIPVSVSLEPTCPLGVSCKIADLALYGKFSVELVPILLPPPPPVVGLSSGSSGAARIGVDVCVPLVGFYLLFKIS